MGVSGGGALQCGFGLCCAAAGWRAGRVYLLDEVNARVVEAVRLGDDLAQGLRLPFGEVRLEVGQLGDALPEHLVRRAEQAEDLEDLINLRVAREERVARHHLRHNRPDRPHIDRARVLLRAEQDLRRAVPERHDLVCVRAEGDGEGAREAKVGELEGALKARRQREARRRSEKGKRGVRPCPCDPCCVPSSGRRGRSAA